MKVKKILGLVSVVLLAASHSASSITLNFGALQGTGVNFSGGNFTFLPGLNGYQFVVTTVNNGVGTSVGLKGYIDSASPFSIGAITVSGADQVAPVNGIATLHITDGASLDLTGSIQWIDIKTSGAAGAININGLVNVTGLSYGGANSDLSALAASGRAIDVVSFTFSPAKTLTDLITTAGGRTSYAGSITSAPVPDAGATVALLGVGLLGLSMLAGRERKP